MPEINILDGVNACILGLVEIDQDCATIEQFHRPASREKVMKRVEEVIAQLMQIREEVKSLTPDSYVDHTKDKK